MDERSRSRGRGCVLGAVVLVLIVVLAVGYIAPLWDYFSPPPAPPPPVEPRGEMMNLEETAITIFEAASPSVVYINTLARRLDPWTRTVMEIPRGTGSGFIWDEAGHVVTNYHVLEGASSAEVVMADQTTYPAELVGVSPAHDLAVLRIDADADELRALPVGSSENLRVGQYVLAIGNPFGLNQTLTTGVISSLGRQVQAPTGQIIEQAIQTDAAINPGNSGGPLLDSGGRLIGVNTAIVSPSGAYAGIGFAVPVSTVLRVVPQLIEQGRYVRPDLGVVFSEQVNRTILPRLGVEGVLVLDVEPGTGGARAGLRPTRLRRGGRLVLGDIILAVDGERVRTVDGLYRRLDASESGDTVTLTLLRDGERAELDVELE
ncbi:MAG: S1C family serine protease [Phycisphaeraceae bacterium]